MTWGTVGGAVIAALSLGTVDHNRHGWLGPARMGSAAVSPLTLPTEATQAGIASFAHAAAPAASANRAGMAQPRR